MADNALDNLRGYLGLTARLLRMAGAHGMPDHPLASLRGYLGRLISTERPATAEELAAGHPPTFGGQGILVAVYEEDGLPCVQVDYGYAWPITDDTVVVEVPLGGWPDPTADDKVIADHIAALDQDWPSSPAPFALQQAEHAQRWAEHVAARARRAQLEAVAAWRRYIRIADL